MVMLFNEWHSSKAWVAMCCNDCGSVTLRSIRQLAKALRPMVIRLFGSSMVRSCLQSLKALSHITCTVSFTVYDLTLLSVIFIKRRPSVLYMQPNSSFTGANMSLSVLLDFIELITLCIASVCFLMFVITILFLIFTHVYNRNEKKIKYKCIFLYPIVDCFMIGCYECDDILSKLY